MSFLTELAEKLKAKFLTIEVGDERYKTKVFNGENLLKTSSIVSLPDMDLHQCWTTRYMFYSCTSLTTATLGDLPMVTDAIYMFDGCTSLVTATLGDLPMVTMTVLMFRNCTSLVTATLGDLPMVTNANYMFQNCTSLQNVIIKSLPDTLSARNNLCNSSPVVFTLTVTGVQTGFALTSSKVSGLRFTNALNTFDSGIDITDCVLDATALNTLFGDLPTVTNKTIIVTGNTGAATCDTSIATNKGWTVTI